MATRRDLESRRSALRGRLLEPLCIPRHGSPGWICTTDPRVIGPVL